jgi:hypothetical protein
MKPNAGRRQPAVKTRAPWACWFCLVTACLSGCVGMNINRTPTPPAPAPVLEERMPTSEDLVGLLNRNAAKVSSLESRDLAMDISADGRTYGVRGTLFCQKERNFRLRAKMPAIGREVADFGSNDREFWYWISENSPPDLFYCSYADLNRGNVRLPFPLHPDWVLEALGVGAPAPVGTPEEETARGRTLEVRRTADKKFVDLYERITSPDGQQVIKVTRVQNFQAQGTVPQVAGYFLYEGRNPQQPVCQASVAKVQYDKQTGATVPEKIKLEWPAMHLSLVLTLGEVSVNNPTLVSNPSLFARPHFRDTKEVDLARAAPIMTPTAVQRAGGYGR